ncbi:MAG: metal-dependent transcriptional regulator [Clostridiales bacterium]|jgi:Mn-dependent DtxR family transcriptional regulator|nr:metal-dependent transcriptional regulator [Clostridiales bacterium]HOA34107.1 metal-dependent transcriptional regulator [Clostridiales bacterium]HOJ34979.1 metal-dependent transcriptional regulator [Clostridiales bacterium]HOL79491.1 metal-dependent transcriptional regulator [Clostridiales bacterium]HPP68144.1 metal-dependent transcriptional regulator [Clostridiales bacterium]
MKMQESGEMYLETILLLTKRGGDVRSIDIVNEMGFSKPSISRAVNLLKKEGYIDIDGAGRITLTEKGLSTATDIYERHQCISKLLQKIGVSPETASKDACRIEHVISEESFEKIKEFIDNENGAN